MKKNKIIILYPYKIKNFDLDRYEIKFLEKNSDLEIHEFSNLLYPKFVSSHKKNYVKNKKIKNYNSIDDWKTYLLNNKIKNKAQKIIVINFLENDSLKTLQIFIYLKKLKIKRIDLFNQGNPNYSQEKDLVSNINSYFLKIKQSMLRTKFVIGYFKSLINQFILNNLVGRIIDLNPEYSFIAGEKFLISKKKNSVLIKGNTWDYSRYLRDSKKNHSKKIKKKYAVFLANPGPKYPSDSLKYGTTISETTENWYSSLNYFFAELEKKFSLKIIVASHPKSKTEKYLNYLGGRLAFKNKTLQLVKNSKFVITQQSQAISFATIYKKSIFFIYSDETKKNPSLMKYVKFLSKLLKGTFVNIDNFYINELNLFTNQLTGKKYKQYIKNYLTLRKDKKPNYEILNNLLKKL